MKYERTPRFDSDVKGLRAEHRRTFMELVPAFAAACEVYAADLARATWPAALRVSPMKSAPGVWEMTWSFASPDGRATFEFVRVRTPDGEEIRVRWRRIRDHGVYRSP